jgi:ABC-type nitrate/sulfonate/bicarbonate transport system permease component
MPYFFASLKIAVAVAFVGSIVAENRGRQQGYRPQSSAG